MSDRAVLCAGVGCEWRRECMRYRIRVAEAKWLPYDHDRIAVMALVSRRGGEEGEQARANVCPAFEQAPQHRRGHSVPR